MSFAVRNTRATDYSELARICREIYPTSPPWSEKQIFSHLKVFPEGQFVVVDTATDQPVGMAASLIIFWDDYEISGSWRDFTDEGMFTNHNAKLGRTLYGAEIMIQPSHQGRGLGKMLYQERENLTRRLGLLRIRAGARLRGYSRYAQSMKPDEYVIRVIKKELTDPTLSFQLKYGFRVLDVVSGYLKYDAESLGNAAIIEWLNVDVAKPEDKLAGNPKFSIQKP